MVTRPCSAMGAALPQPIWLPPRTTFGAPITTCSPASRAALATASDIGNSQTRAPSARNAARASGVASSWLSIGMPAACAAADSRAWAAGTSGRRAMAASAIRANSATGTPPRWA